MTFATGSRRNIAVLYTGGTIGMQAGDHGLRPSKESVLDALAAYQQDIDWHVQVCEPLIDSSLVLLFSIVRSPFVLYIMSM